MLILLEGRNKNTDAAWLAARIGLGSFGTGNREFTKCRSYMRGQRPQQVGRTGRMHPGPRITTVWQLGIASDEGIAGKRVEI